ncbi:MAG: hypothetical protein MJ231_07535 [bacterium]|nr:hypothetical protein [bacterium]
MSKTKKVNILYLTLLFFYAAVASVAFVFASMSQETIFNNGRIVGARLALSYAPYLFVYAIAQDFKSTRKSMYAAFGIIGIVLGITCFFLETPNIEVLNTICMIRGIFDIIRLTIVLADIIPSIFEKKWMELVELFVSIGETIIAVFLIIDGFEGVRTHFFYMGCAFVILFLKCLIEKLIEVRKEKNEKGSHNN